MRSTGSAIDATGTLAWAAKYDKLETLSLSDCKQSAGSLSLLSSLVNLTWLGLYGTQCTGDLAMLAPLINLNVANSWGILKAIIDLCLQLEEGKYLLLKDPNKPVVRFYSVPENTFDEPDEPEALRFVEGFRQLLTRRGRVQASPHGHGALLRWRLFPRPLNHLQLLFLLLFFPLRLAVPSVVIAARSSALSLFATDDEYSRARVKTDFRSHG